MTNKKPTPIKASQKGALTKALFEFQTRFPGVKKTRTNTFTNSLYASLDDVMNEADPLLEELQIAVFYVTNIVPNPDNSGYTTLLICRLLHIPSNEVMESSLPLPDISEGAQLIGGYMTYWRRYLFCGMTNIVETDDDDGNSTAVSPVAPRLTEKQHSEILDFVEATGTNMGDPDTPGTLLHHVSTVMDLTELEQLSSRQATTIIKMLKTKLARIEAK